MPFLISEILASNIGGDSDAHRRPAEHPHRVGGRPRFRRLPCQHAPIALAILAVYLVLLRFMFGRDLAVHADVRDAVLALDEREVLNDIRLLRLSLVVLAATIVGFVLRDAPGPGGRHDRPVRRRRPHLLSRLDVESVFREVEWPTLFFFVGLFMLVEAVVHVGIIDRLADA